MNGVFALCHFCEQHGPRIVFSTQAFHSIGTNPEDFVEDRSEAGDGHSLGGEELSLLDVSHSSLGSAASSFSEKPDEAPSIAEGCAACRWSVAVPGFVTHDESAKTTYVSTHYPRRSELFSTVRRACVRSLSCEVCPGREGPLLFGDEEHGYVFSYAFFLKDHEARGMQRWYASPPPVVGDCLPRAHQHTRPARMCGKEAHFAPRGGEATPAERYKIFLVVSAFAYANAHAHTRETCHFFCPSCCAFHKALPAYLPCLLCSPPFRSSNPYCSVTPFATLIPPPSPFPLFSNHTLTPNPSHPARPPARLHARSASIHYPPRAGTASSW